MNCQYCSGPVTNYACPDCNVNYYQPLQQHIILYKKYMLVVGVTECHLFAMNKLNNNTHNWGKIIKFNNNINNLSLSEIHQKIDRMIIFI